MILNSSHVKYHPIHMKVDWIFGTLIFNMFKGEELEAMIYVAEYLFTSICVLQSTCLLVYQYLCLSEYLFTLLYFREYIFASAESQMFSFSLTASLSCSSSRLWCRLKWWNFWRTSAKILLLNIWMPEKLQVGSNVCSFEPFVNLRLNCGADPTCRCRVYLHVFASTSGFLHSMHLVCLFV